MAVAECLSLILGLTTAVFVFSCSGQSPPTSTPFPPMPGRLPDVDDGVSEPILIPGGFPFGAARLDSVYISTNGFFTFGSPNSRCCPPSSAEGVDIDYLVSPFWTNFDNSLGGAILYNIIVDDDALQGVNGYISEQTGTIFSGRWALATSWSAVPAFNGSANITNAVSGLVITDRMKSYAIFSYICGSINHGNDAVIGFRATESFAEYHPLSFGNATVIGCFDVFNFSEFTLLLYDLTPNTTGPPLSNMTGRLPTVNDGVSRPIPIRGGFPFGDTIHNRVFVSTNGYITFSEPTTTCCPVRFDFFSTPVFIVAPYWADSDIRQGGTVIYDVYDDRGPELELLNHVINDRFGIDFEGQWGLTAQWFQVPQFGREEPEVNNTFTAAVVTDRRQSYAVFAYQCGGINWGDEAIIGFRANGALFDSHPLSHGTATEIDCAGGESTSLVYNLTRGDSLYGTLRPLDDGVSSRIPISTGFPFGDSVQTEAYVGIDGYIVFGRPLVICCPNFQALNRFSPDYILAPFWSDISIRQSGRVDYNVYEGRNVTEIQRASDVMAGFDGTWMLIARWVDVPQRFNNGTDNTFVAVAITNGHQSLVAFLYVCGEVNWGMDNSVAIGFKATGSSLRNFRPRNTTVTDIDCISPPVTLMIYDLVNVPPSDDVNVSFVEPMRSVFEGVKDGAVEVCLNVSGRITEGRNYSVTIVGDLIRTPSVLQRIVISRTGNHQCHSIRGVIVRDGVLRDETTNPVAIILGLRSNSVAVRIIDPRNTYFAIIEEEIVLLNFTRPFYVVTESEGLDEVCVRLELPRGRVIRRPVTFRTHILPLGGRRRRQRSLPWDFSRPQIGYFNIGARDGDEWCLSVSLMDDEDPEPPRRLQVELFVSDVNVVPVRRVVNLTIIDDDLTTPTPTSTTPAQSPTPTEPPPALEAFFAGGTPRVEGDRLVMQVNTNKLATITCRINASTSVDCSPGRLTTIGPIVPGTYAVRAIVTTADERVVVETISVAVPEGNGCSAHLINRGVTVRGNSARVEFSGAGFRDEAAYICRHNSGEEQQCTSPLVLTDLEPGAQRVRITPQCSDRTVTVARFNI